MLQGKIILIILFLSISTSGLKAQFYPEVWDSTVFYQTDYFKIEVPQKWRYNKGNSSYTNKKNTLMIFEGSGIGFPFIVNDNPLIINAYIIDAGKSNSLDSFLTKFLIDMEIGKDTEKIFDVNSETLVEEFITDSGDTGKLVKHRYFRKSKGLYQTRFTLVLIDPGTNFAYVYGISYEYDGDYKSVEDYLKIPEFTKRIYKKFSFK